MRVRVLTSGWSKRRRLAEGQTTSNRTLTDVLEDAIRSLLADVGSSRAQSLEAFPVFDGGTRPGTLPGVDLDDNAALLDVLEPPPGRR